MEGPDTGYCPMCYDSPCICGYDYKDWTVRAIEEQIEMLKKILEIKKMEGEDGNC